MEYNIYINQIGYFQLSNFMFKSNIGLVGYESTTLDYISNFHALPLRYGAIHRMETITSCGIIH